MKLAHNIKINVFVKPEEDEEKLKNALLSIIPFDIKKEKVKLTRSIADGFDNRKIVILEIVIVKERLTNQFLNALIEKLSDKEKDLLVKQENRLDEECCFFIRLDKQKLLEDKIRITDAGECFHIAISVAAYPKKKENAREIVKNLFRR